MIILWKGSDRKRRHRVANSPLGGGLMVAGVAVVAALRKHGHGESKMTSSRPHAASASATALNGPSQRASLSHVTMKATHAVVLQLNSPMSLDSAPQTDGQLETSPLALSIPTSPLHPRVSPSPSQHHALHCSARS